MSNQGNQPTDQDAFQCDEKEKKNEHIQHKMEEKEDGELDEDDDYYEDYDDESLAERTLKRNQEFEIQPLEFSDTRVEDNKLDIQKLDASEMVSESSNKEESKIDIKSGQEDDELKKSTQSPVKNQIEMDVSDYDDDDDFCLDSKRLKIDESDVRDTTTTDTQIQSQTSIDHMIKSESHDKLEKLKQLAEESNQDFYKAKTIDPVTSKESNELENEVLEDRPSPSDSSVGSSNSATNISSVSSSKGTVSSASMPATGATSTCSGPPADQQSHSTTGAIAAESSPSLSSSPPPENLPNIANDIAASNNNCEEKPKIPPLKIICSQSSNGGLPYVKPPQQGLGSDSSISSGSGSETNGSSNKPTTRSKVAAAAAAAAAASSSNSSPRKTPTNPRSSPLTISSITQSTSLNVNSLPLGQTNNLNLTSSGSISETAEMAVARRKLRSHTRLNPGAISPLSIPNINPMNNSNEQLNDQSGIESTDIGSNIELSHQNDNQTESMNDSTIEACLMGTNASGFGRKRKPRQQITTQSINQSSAPEETSSSATANTVSPVEISISTAKQPTVDANSTCNSLNETSIVAGSSTNDSTSQVMLSTEMTSVVSNPSNCIKKFLELKNEATKKREVLMQTRTEIKLPKNFQDFRLFKRNYLIRSNKEICQSMLLSKPPNDIPEDLKPLFFKQEHERYRLRIQHRVELEKLIVLYEEEILRSYYRLQRDEHSIYVPLSFCSIINDDDVNATTTSPTCIPSNITPKVDSTTNSENSNEQALFVDNKTQQNFEKMMNCFNSIKKKFINLRDVMIKRQLHESDSLQAIQKMDFQSRVRELAFKNKVANTNNANLNGSPITPFHFQFNDYHVPIVTVNSKLDLFDISSLIEPNHNHKHLSPGSKLNSDISNLSHS